MIEKATSYLEQANNFYVNLMFCAASKNILQSKFDKNKYLYTIFCLEIIEGGKFIIFIKLFKPTKRKNKHGYLLKIEQNTTQIFETINEANNYVNSFISSFSEHERILNNLVEIEDNIPAGSAILLVNGWEKSILDHFNYIVKNSLQTNSE